MAEPLENTKWFWVWDQWGHVKRLRAHDRREAVAEFAHMYELPFGSALHTAKAEQVVTFEIGVAG